MCRSVNLVRIAAATRTTDLLNFPDRFHRAIDILYDKSRFSFNNDLGDQTAMELVANN
jgi:hypothetical protein